MDPRLVLLRALSGSSSASIDRLVDQGLVLRDALEFVESRTPEDELVQVNLRGRLVCASLVVVVVNSWFAVRRGRGNRYAVLGTQYSYHAYKRGRPRRDVLRYDDSHGQLHRHHFDRQGREIGIEPVDLDDLPRLDQIVFEAVLLGDDVLTRGAGA